MRRNIALFVFVMSFWLIIPPALAAEPVNQAIPPEVVTYAEDWPLPNFDYNNTRATVHSPINSATVTDLGLAWSQNITGVNPFGGAQTNPIIMGETVYFQDGRANVSAIDLRTGAVQWRSEPTSDLVLGPNGPAVGWGKVFFARGVYTMTAVNATDGSEIWSTKLSNVATTGIDIQPAVYDGLVYASTVPGIGDIDYAPGGIGMITALDQETGEVVWNVSTVDSPDLWGHPEINSGGGCWYTPSIDLATGTTFWGTGNPAPFAGTGEYPNGASRPGPNLYTNSLLALNHSTGSMTWYTQVDPHGLFDYDFQIPPILARANSSGFDQEIVIGAGKMGRVYAFNRTNGLILWATVVGRHQNDQLAALPPGRTTVYPGTLGGIETPMAYSDGVVFAAYNNLYTNWSPDASFGGNVTPYIPPYPEGSGGLVAIDVDTGKIVWDRALPIVDVGGATVVNDLVFTGTFDGIVYAFNRTTGEEVWNYTAPDRITAWPAVANDTIVWPAGGGFDSNGTPSLIALRIGG